VSGDAWAQPTAVDDLTLAFPANVVGTLMPSRDECEAGLDALTPKEQLRWRHFQQQWFHGGLPVGVSFHMRPGVDGDTALRHLRAIQGSFEPKHEHREAAVAYLASRWFKKVEGL
jgi:hypothetical protein